MKVNIRFKDMTKSYRRPCGLILAFLVIGMPSISLGQVSHSVSFSISNLVFTSVITENGIAYEKVSLSDLQQTDEIGKPSLLVKYVKLIVPSSQDVDKIVLNKIEKEDIPGFHLIYPVQPDVPTLIDYRNPEFVKPDSTVYGSDEPYPSEILKVVHEGYFDGSNHIVKLAVYPLQYYPKSGRLTFFSTINFTLKMKSAKTKVIHVRSRSAKNQKIYDSILKKIVDNPQDIPMYQVRPPLGKAGAIQSGPIPFYEYVIITSNALKSSFDPFVSWKRRKGLGIGVVTTEEIFANYTGDFISGIYDDAGKIRQYLSDAYQSGTVWALLAGDHTIVPVRYGDGRNNSSWDENSEYRIPADLYFADFNGDWHVDTETPTRYGEMDDDDPDYNPEIFVGRLPCTNAQDIANWVEKVLKYEQNPGNGDNSYLKNAFWIQGPNIWVHPDQVKTHCPPAFVHTVWDQNPPHKGSEVVAKMSVYFGLLNWHCHGAPIHFEVKPYPNRFVWTKDDYCYSGGCSDETGDGLDNMTNDKYYSVVYSICCDIAAFDDFKSTDYPGRCMAEGFTCFFDHRAGPELLGNTRYGWQNASPELQKDFYDLLTAGTQDPESGESYFHLGVSELVSKQNFVYYSYYDHYLNYSHNCFGCPETEIYTDTPSQFTNVTITDNGSSITVNAGLSGSNICVCSGNNGASYHLLAHNVSSYTFTTSVRPLYITITKHNYIPYTAVTGGTFTSNEIWFGNLQVLGTVVIDNGKTLTIQPGTTVKFAPETWLSVYGTLEAVGTSSDRITFTRSGTSNWEGIYLQSNTDDSKVWYADIDHASQGLHIGFCSASIIHTKIHYCDNALFSAFAHPDFSYNDIYQTGGDGIFAYGSIITMNHSHYNVITQNAGCGVQGTGSTTVFADYGGNSIYNNLSREMRMTSGSVAYAEYNWWGSDPPDSNEFEGPVDYDPWLGSNPNPGRPKPLVIASLDEKVKQAHELLSNGMYEEAMQLAEAIIEESPNSLAGFSALNIIRFAHWESGRPGFDSYVLDLAAQYNHEEMEGVALLNYAAELVRRGDYERALTTLEGLRRTRSGTDFEKLALFTELLVYQEVLGDAGGALRVFSTLNSRYPDDLLTAQAERLLDTHRSPRPGKQKEEPEETLPEGFVLFQNYPNPANPTTKITFTLPKTTHVTLKIYNLLGQRVRTLVEGVKEAGSHTAVWDGRDESGNTLPSGVYLYRLRAGETVQTKKMLLLR